MVNEILQLCEVAINKFLYYSQNWDNCELEYKSLNGEIVIRCMPGFFQALHFPLFQLLASYMKEIGAKTIWTASRLEYVPYTRYLASYVEANGSRGLLIPIRELNDNPYNSILKM